MLVSAVFRPAPHSAKRQHLQLLDIFILLQTLSFDLCDLSAIGTAKRVQAVSVVFHQVTKDIGCHHHIDASRIAATPTRPL